MQCSASQGAENCLEGLTFVITGVLECIERDEAKSLIERYGGKVTGNVSKKTNYLVMGRDCGQAKCEKVGSCAWAKQKWNCSFHLCWVLSAFLPRGSTAANKVHVKKERLPHGLGLCSGFACVCENKPTKGYFCVFLNILLESTWERIMWLLSWLNLTSNPLFCCRHLL